jgi:hypothetical protein
MPRLFRDQDFLAGLAFISFAVIYGWLGSDLDFGTLRRMGPGFFPTVLATVLVLIGLFLAVRAIWHSGEQFNGFAGKAIVLVGAATVSFGLLLKSAGMILAVAVVVVISSLASRSSRPLSTILGAVVLCAMCGLVFVEGLGLPMPLIGSWFTN